MNAVRPPVRLTSRVLTLGSLAAAAILGLGLVVGLAGMKELGGFVGNIGVVVLLLTPVSGLIATWLELRAVRPRYAWIASAVLGVLAVATVVALVTR